VKRENASSAVAEIIMRVRAKKVTLVAKGVRAGGGGKRGDLT